jgi:hypothetical protein
MLLWLVAGAAAFMGGFVHGLSGFGSILVALPFFAMVMGIKTAVPVAVLMAMLINTLLVRSEFEHIARRDVVEICLWTLPGIFLGSYILQTVGEAVLHLLLGVTLLFFVLTNLFRPQKAQKKLPHAARAAAGFAAGIFGGSTGTSGPPIIIYCMTNNWPKETARATMLGTFFIVNIIIITHQIAVGLTTLHVLKLFAFCLPLILLGMYIGKKCWGYIDDKTFRRLVLCLLSVLAVLEIIKGLQ